MLQVSRFLLNWSSVAFVCFLFLGCTPRFHDSYIKNYQHLRDIREKSSSCEQFEGNEEYFLAVCVDARHLDYTSPESFFMSMRYGLFLPQEPTIGHAWIRLSGKINEKPWSFEGGHTGEFGLTAPKYFDEVVRRSVETSDPDPAKYLFSALPDGYLQKGSGGHDPTLSVVFPLTRKEFITLYQLIQKYNFSEWSLLSHQCVHFVVACLEAIHVQVDCDQVIHLPRDFEWRGKKIRLWQDAKYEKLTFASPDALEKALFREVLKKRALLSTKWYTRTK